MIATRDIGAAVAEMLLKPDFTGKLPRELLGERDVSYAEIATIVGKAVGRSGLSYTKLPPAQLRPAMAQFGMSESMVDLLLEMAEALNSGYMVALESRTKRNSTSTSIETFINEEFLPRLQAAYRMRKRHHRRRLPPLKGQLRIRQPENKTRSPQMPALATASLDLVLSSASQPRRWPSRSLIQATGSREPGRLWGGSGSA